MYCAPTIDPVFPLHTLLQPHSLPLFLGVGVGVAHGGGGAGALLQKAVFESNSKTIQPFRSLFSNFVLCISTSTDDI